MGINPVDTVKSTFGSLNTATGLKVIGLLFVVQLINSLAGMAYQTGMAAALGGAAVTLLAAAASAVIAVGALRSFEHESFERSQYTENLLWPVVRTAGSNTVSTGLAYGLGVLAAAPVILIRGLLGSGSMIGTALSLVAITIGAAVFLYVVLTMIVAVPMIATSDRRMFQALDTSIRRTKGYRKSMAVSFLPLAFIYLLALTGLSYLPVSGTMTALLGAVSALVSAAMFAAVLSLLVEYDQRLPEV